jgi:hypothetical protein
MKLVAALLVAAVAFLAVELGMGAWNFGEPKRQNPCITHAQFHGSGIDAVFQRIVLDGLNGAACELHTTREQFVLSLQPSSGSHRRWDDETIQRAVRAGLVRSIDEAEQRGDVPSVIAPVLKAAAEHAPVKFLLEGLDLRDLLGRLF